MSLPFRVLRIALLALPLLALSACDSSDDDAPRIGVSGSWEGELVSQDANQVLPVQLTLNDTGATVTGSGSVTLPNGPLSFSVASGLYAGNKVSLSLFYDRPPQGSISGFVSADRDAINGNMSGPGLVNGALELALRRSN